MNRRKQNKKQSIHKSIEAQSVLQKIMGKFESSFQVFVFPKKKKINKKKVI